MFCFAVQCNRADVSNAKLQLQDVVMLIIHREKQKGKLNEDVMNFGPQSNRWGSANEKRVVAVRYGSKTSA